jgi:hypothetical protein
VEVLVALLELFATVPRRLVLPRGLVVAVQVAFEKANYYETGRSYHRYYRFKG